MLAKLALLIAVCLTCVSCYSVGDSYFRRLSGKASEICADGKCACNPGETCCQNDGHYCCPVKDGTCCSGSDSCCPSDKPQCAHCAGPEIPQCCDAKAKCCGTSCCTGVCALGVCIGGNVTIPAIPKVKRPNGSKDQCIGGTTTSPQTTTTIAGQHRDCAGWRKTGSKHSGIYTIITNTGPLQVYCDMTTDGGGWIVIQRRENGRENFLQAWVGYAKGFGNLTAEFWLGNSHISDISLADTQTLRIDLTDCKHNTYYEVYQQFRLGNEQTNFTLHLDGTATGTAGDSLMYQCPGRYCQNGMPFTTVDRDNDNIPFGNCAIFQTGAWWYNACGVSDLNGQYNPTCTCPECNPYQTGIYWHTYKNNAGEGYSFRKTEMKIRPTSFIPRSL